MTIMPFGLTLNNPLVVVLALSPSDSLITTTRFS